MSTFDQRAERLRLTIGTDWRVYCADLDCTCPSEKEALVLDFVAPSDVYAFTAGELLEAVRDHADQWPPSDGGA